MDYSKELILTRIFGNRETMQSWARGLKNDDLVEFLCLASRSQEVWKEHLSLVIEVLKKEIRERFAELSVRRIEIAALRHAYEVEGEDCTIDGINPFLEEETENKAIN